MTTITFEPGRRCGRLAVRCVPVGSAATRRLLSFPDGRRHDAGPSMSALGGSMPTPRGCKKASTVMYTGRPCRPAHATPSARTLLRDGSRPGPVHGLARHA
ncbi:MULTISPECIES: hypothetical protein [Streptomyces]|uniref:Uncharacterized protein n=1 Tax=Streptomyces sp. NBC_00093 TaxID=2975649 RepID=A0AAU1ZSA0_9ACTN